MKFRAGIRDESVRECTWFVYVESTAGTVFACRFSNRSHAERVARVMNAAWESEGRLLRREAS